MPTGYTAIIEEGCSFEEYVWKCARAFGVLVNMREEPSDAEIPTELKISTYYSDRMVEIEAELKELNNKNDVQLVALLERAKEEAIKSNKERLEAHNLKMQRYADIEAQVMSWNPPTSDHVGMKDFMLQQIAVSTEYDTYYQEQIIEILPSIYREKQKANLLKEFENCKVEFNKEVKRINERNKWLQALRKSVPLPRKD